MNLFRRVGLATFALSFLALGRISFPQPTAAQERETGRSSEENRPSDGERPNPKDPRKEESGLRNFKPQTKREAELYKMILKLERELAELRRQVELLESKTGTGGRDGEIPVLRPGWEKTKAGGVFSTYDKNRDGYVTLDEWLAMTNGNVSDARRKLQTQRFREAGPGKDGKMSAAEFVNWWNKRTGAKQRDGDRSNRGPRDGERGDRDRNK